MAVNIKFYYTLTSIALAALCLATYHVVSYAANELPARPAAAIPVRACVVRQDTPLSVENRLKIAQCLGWQDDASIPLCQGSYSPRQIAILPEDEIRILADEVTFNASGRSQLKGNVEVQQTQQIINAQTAYIYRDNKTNKVTKIELIDDVRYMEPDRLMLARKAIMNPQDKSGQIEDVLYLFNTDRAGAILPAWGRASRVERFPNQDYLLRKVSYTTCKPQDKAWEIQANQIKLDKAREKGIARNAVLRIGDWPVLYTPYLSFPTTKKRKTGFLMPMPGYSNVGGADLALPYYLNLAPNYDATIVPHLYTLRGMMLGGDFRFLTDNSNGIVGGNVLPNDKAFNKFIINNQDEFPVLRGASNDRWSVMLHENTAFSSNLHMNINYQQVSDDYYLQDFSSNLAIMTQNQLLRHGDLTYTTDHWLLSGAVQSYQTLHPITQSAISDIYERLPQLLAVGAYNDLPLNAEFNILSEFDNYRWPANNFMQPQGPRYHLNPTLAFPYLKPWGHITPSVQVVENYYDVSYIGEQDKNAFNRTIPRYNIDAGLTFERPSLLAGKAFTQTLEPRLYYLNVPFQNQTPIPVYDSAYMIFNYDQLFRTNRFSGFDRIGDANQLAYAATSRWLSEETGLEKASVSIGQMRYFATRRVQLCYQQEGNCVDSPLTLGYVSPEASSSPIASRAMYQLSSSWMASGDYVWDPYTRATNNGNLNFHYQPETNHIISFGYTYLVGGNLLQVTNQALQTNPLHQATVAYAWPFTEHWSSLGAYSYNISESYSMMSFAGLQYDNCCWAMRLLGGRTFRNLSQNNGAPQYNNNVYFQILLKGLGSAANSDPATTIGTYLPGYRNMF